MILVTESFNNQPKTKAECLNCGSENFVLSIKVSRGEQTSFTVFDLCHLCRHELILKLESEL